MKKPLLFITAGDPCGIGPEVTVKALQNSHVQSLCTPVLIGEPDTLRAAGWQEKSAPLIPIQSLHKKPARRGPSVWGGEISFKALQLACKLAAQHPRSAIVTAPISKQS